jgi:hypothetical protein
VKVVRRRDISRFHSYLVRVINETARPYFACERLSSVLVVFELDHRLILLEPFKTLHKGNFARSPAFNCMTALTLTSSRVMRQCSMCAAVRDRRRRTRQESFAR